jgi:hypothetical protein
VRIAITLWRFSQGSPPVLARAHKNLAPRNKPGPSFRATNPVCKPGGRNMVLYEMLQLALYEVVIASGIGVVLVAATIGGLIARVMMGP